MTEARASAAGVAPVTAVLVAVVAALTPGAAAAQDIEMSSVVSHVPLPAGFATRRARTPGAFEVTHGWIARARDARAAGEPVVGTLPMIVVTALFADSNVPTVSASDLQAVLFDGPNPAGTLSEFYESASHGRLRVRGSVTPWVRTSLTAAEARAGSFGLGDDALTGVFITEALTAADPMVDFGAFDNDGPDGVPNSGDDDGFVDVLAVEFLEAPLTCQGLGPTIWAHRWRVDGWTGAPFVTGDLRPDGTPVLANDYIVQAAERCNGAVQTPVTIAHELGHILGLPDLYDQTEGILPAQRSWVVGCWSIMAAGQWGCGEALAQGRWDRPPHFGPWEKLEMGWVPEPVVAEGVVDREVVLRPAETSGDLLVLPLTSSESLLVEYRDGSGFDRNLPATGVLVYHVDEDRPNGGGRRCRTCPPLYRVQLVEADANRSLTTPEGQGGNRGQPGDVFVSPGVRLTAVTTPSTRLNSGAASGVSIYDVRVEDGVARLRVSTRVLGLDVLTQPFLGGGEGPGEDERTYLDRVGNGDGRFDVGDLRRYLREHPRALAAAGGS